MTITYDVKKSWVNIKEAFDDVNNSFLRRIKTTAKNEWISEEILEIMEQHKQCTIKQDQEEYQNYSSRKKMGD